ncbi:MAG: TonB-dependent receptor, partial [Betaproteobacteria bacterium]|nr:TonB-dependent receptor [Betaproteobacteria bacterium]
APSPPVAKPAANPASQPNRVEVRGQGLSDDDQRRFSTAAKIVIGREQIEQFGDSSVSEVLRRLPGITLGGAPGRGGPPRMRGLGAGYTQILIDGERTPPGFSIDSLTPEQVERIEILRAPTAETGARAIGGTINIITREGFVRRLNDLRLGVGMENGRASPGVSWTYNNSNDHWIYNISMSSFYANREERDAALLRDVRLDNEQVIRSQRSETFSETQRYGLNLTARLQQRGAMGETFLLIPSLFHAQGNTKRTFTLNQLSGTPDPSASPFFDFGNGAGSSDFTVGRLTASLRRNLAPGTRLEVNSSASAWVNKTDSGRQEFNRAGLLLRSAQEDSRVEEQSLSFTGKLSKVLENDHSLVAGVELAPSWREESKRQSQDGVLILTEFGENLKASSHRLAAYAQDEWAISPRWAAHAGIRWEAINTKGETISGNTPENQSSVWTPLFHTVWKPDEKSRDQVRLSLTRSYKSPTLATLIARPSVDARYPVSGGNTVVNPDRAGNPELRPELATGVDLAFESYFRDGGSLSVNLFHREIRDYMRSVTSLETVSWSAFPRWVSRMQNVGDAFTQGIEFEAKFRLDQIWPAAPRTEIKSNVSRFNSEVKSVPGPNNRLDQQPRFTGNVGLDHRFRQTPLRLGGNLNFTPGFTTRTEESAVLQSGLKRVWDAYGLWIFSPNSQVRLSASNLHPIDFVSTRAQVVGSLRQEVTSFNQSYINWRIQWELKL